VKKSLGVAIIPALAVAAAAQQEPAARRLNPIPIQANTQFMTVSGVREMKGGLLLVTDAKKPAIYRVDTKTGNATMLGSVGADSGQYVQPGGFYSGRGDTTFVLDRGQARISLVSSTSAIVGIRSIRRVGVTGSSSADVDYQRVDSRGLAYFTERVGRLAAKLGGTVSDSIPLIRFDPLRQHCDTVALLRTREQRIVSMDEHSQVTSAVFGSPEDTWGVASDGRVAVVRAAPYRVEWYAPGGVVTRGPVIAHEPIPYTPAEKAAVEGSSAASVSGGGTAGGAERGSAGGGRATPAPTPRVFAPNKPPFEPNGEAIVSPEGRVWVSRNLPEGAAKTIYDVFDGKGDRVDRVELPARNRVVGFGQGTIYAAERDDHGAVSLRKYSVEAVSR
jgi:hypothetical protein